MRKNKTKNFILNVTLDSNYYPVKPKEHEHMVDCVADNVLNRPRENRIIIDQDRNAKIGIRVPVEPDELSEKSIGPFDMPNSNKKGRNLLAFIRSNYWIVANTCFKHNSYAAWKDISIHKKRNHVDHFIIDQKIRECTDD